LQSLQALTVGPLAVSNKFPGDVEDVFCSCCKLIISATSVEVYNNLDLAGIIAWIIFRKTTAQPCQEEMSYTRWQKQQQQPVLHHQLAAAALMTAGQLGKRVNCKVKAAPTRNHTVTVCSICKRPTCGPCIALQIFVPGAKTMFSKVSSSM